VEKDLELRKQITQLEQLVESRAADLAETQARLLAAEQQRADELDALRTTMADITAELELSSLLQAIVERATKLLNVTGGELGLYDEAKQEVRIVVSNNLGEGHVDTRHTHGEGVMGRVGLPDLGGKGTTVRRCANICQHGCAAHGWRSADWCHFHRYG